MATGGLGFSSCTFHLHYYKTSAWDSQPQTLWADISFHHFYLLDLVWQDPATQDHMRLNICHFAFVTRPLKQRREKHKACDAGVWISSQRIQHSTIPNPEICQFQSSCSITHHEICLRSPPDQLMWFLGPEQKQQCQQSMSCSSGSWAKRNFSVFTNMHTHGFPHKAHSIAKKIHHWSFVVFARQELKKKAFLTMTCCFAPKWLSVSLFRSKCYQALKRLSHWSFASRLPCTQFYLWLFE